MKNQYFADVGDYGKYGLLRHIIKNNISVAINWYLTENDPPKTIKKQNDGKYIRYLEKESKYIDCDRDLYEFLRDTHPEIPDNRNVKHIENSGLLKNTLFFSDILYPWMELSVEQRTNKRKQWHQKALKSLAPQQIVFLDPDNGFKKDPKRSLDRKASKHAFISEIEDYYADHDIDACHYIEIMLA